MLQPRYFKSIAQQGNTSSCKGKQKRSRILRKLGKAMGTTILPILNKRHKKTCVSWVKIFSDSSTAIFNDACRATLD